MRTEKVPKFELRFEDWKIWITCDSVRYYSVRFGKWYRSFGIRLFGFYPLRSTTVSLIFIIYCISHIFNITGKKVVVRIRRNSIVPFIKTSQVIKTSQAPIKSNWIAFSSFFVRVRKAKTDEKKFSLKNTAAAFFFKLFLVLFILVLNR